MRHTKPSTVALCGAKLRKKDRTCKQTAGSRTDHPRIGRCWLHGGISATIKHGLYSKVLRAQYQDLIAEIKQHPDLHTMDDDIAFLTVLVGKIADCEALRGQEPGQLVAISQMVERRLEAIKTKSQVELAASMKITEGTVQAVAARFMSILRKHVADPRILTAIQADLAGHPARLG